MIKILKMISNFIFRKVSHKNKKQILGSVGDGTLNKDNNKIIYIKDYLK